MIEVKIDSAQVEVALRKLEQASHQLGPVYNAIATEMLSITEANFSAEGHPSWPKLASATIDRRIKLGAWPGKILQVSGGLAASVTADSSATFARVGSAKQYAAIHQMGGQAGRKRKATIPARPFLPFTGSSGSGQLQPRAEQAVIEIVLEHLQKAAGV